MRRCNLTKLNGTEIPTFNFKVQVIFLTIKLNVNLAWRNKIWVSYAKLNGIGTLVKLIPSHSIFNYLGDIQNPTNVQPTRCKHVNEWHINILHIFLYNFHI